MIKQVELCRPFFKFIDSRTKKILNKINNLLNLLYKMKKMMQIITLIKKTKYLLFAFKKIK
jgi:hypothetical protein